MFCGRCGGEIKEESNFCKTCGNPAQFSDGVKHGNVIRKWWPIALGITLVAIIVVLLINMTSDSKRQSSVLEQSADIAGRWRLYSVEIYGEEMTIKDLIISGWTEEPFNFVLEIDDRNGFRMSLSGEDEEPKGRWVQLYEYYVFGFEEEGLPMSWIAKRSDEYLILNIPVSEIIGEGNNESEDLALSDLTYKAKGNGQYITVGDQVSPLMSGKLKFKRI